jgi:hypothetical protein
MATTTLYFTSSTSGNITTPANALGAADDSWAGSNQAFTHRWRFQTISGGPWSPSGTQSIDLLFKKNATGGGTPAVTSVRLFEGSTDKGLIFNTSTSITSNTGQIITVTFASSLITDFINIDLEITATSNGGGPNQRGVQIDSATWTAQYDEVISHINAWSGETWVTGRLRKWGGSSWLPAIVKRWDGSQWVNVP